MVRSDLSVYVDGSMTGSAGNDATDEVNDVDESVTGRVEEGDCVARDAEVDDCVNEDADASD